MVASIGDVREFSKNLEMDRRREFGVEGYAKFAGNIMTELARGAIFKTRVKTGKARGGWVASTGTPSDATFATDKASAAATETTETACETTEIACSTAETICPTVAFFVTLT